MSGNPTGSNVVPMPHAAAPAGAQPQMPIPFPMWGGGGSLPWGPGCCPPGGMDALMKCYCDVQAATAFICSVMVQCVQTNPAVTAAIIAAIEASGSNLPTTGVTNGSNAQPGQVGEYFEMTQTLTAPATANTQVVSMGVLSPGDWQLWSWADFPGGAAPTDAGWSTDPTPAGFSHQLYAGIGLGISFPNLVLVSNTVRASLSVPTLVALSVSTNTTGNASGAIGMQLTVSARRMR